MNERIKLLALQAGAGRRAGVGGLVFRDNELEKFAELIVQEMIGLLEQYSRDSFPEDIMGDFDKGYQGGLYTAQKAVKDHFGVDK